METASKARLACNLFHLPESNSDNTVRMLQSFFSEKIFKKVLTFLCVSEVLDI